MRNYAKAAAAAAIQASKAEAEAFRFNADVYARNADLVERNALIDEARQRREGRRFMGQQNAAIASSGFDNDVGFAALREDTERELDLDAIIIRRQGQFAAADYDAQEELAIMSADQAITAGRTTSRNTILEGAMRANALINEGRVQGQTAKASATAGTIGMVMNFVGSLFSDMRVKENIAPAGRHPSGLPLYTFNYIWDDPGVRRIGVMAQEARDRFPAAVGVSSEGILTVDYSKLG